MLKRKWKIGYPVRVALIISAALLVPMHKVFALPIEERIAGENRYKTSFEILKHGWQQMDNVVIVNGENFPDGLSAAPLAKELDAPMILTKPDELDTEILDKIKELNPKKIFIIGGEGVVSTSLEEILKSSLSGQVIRLSGKSRYETSINIADYMYANFDVGREVAVVNGENFPDALSIAPIAAIKGMPIILTTNSDMSKEIDDFLIQKQIDKSYIIGGTGVISDELANKFPGKDRIWGKDRYETNINIINFFKQDCNKYDKNLYVVSGENFPDALGAAPWLARLQKPLLLTSSQPEELTRRYSYNLLGPLYYPYIFIIGGTGSITEDAVQKLITKENNAVLPGKVTIGMTRDEVLKIMGTPHYSDEAVNHSQLDYGFDSNIFVRYNPNETTTNIHFIRDKSTNQYIVAGWSLGSNSKISSKIDIGERKPNAAPVTLGSDIDDIAAALGTPRGVSKGVVTGESTWHHLKDTTVYLDANNYVIGWDNEDNLNISLGEKDLYAPGITKGSYIADVVKAMGSTNRIMTNSMPSEITLMYGKSYITIDDNGRVKGWANNGELKLLPSADK